MFVPMQAKGGQDDMKIEPKWTEEQFTEKLKSKSGDGGGKG